MVTKRIIPCLDCKDGRVVKGIQFQGLTDAGSPSELAARYELEGADELVVLDVGATVGGRDIQMQTVKEVRAELSIPLTVGGGVRTVEDIEKLLHSGADKVSMNSAAVANPNLVAEASKAFGAQCTVVAIDTKRFGKQWMVLTKSGTEPQPLDTIDWAKKVEDLGAGEILLTSFDRDGTQLGYDLELLLAVTDAVQIPVIASGGAKVTQDLVRAFEAGADAVLAASMFHYQTTTIGKVKQELRQAGVEVRL
ncbi:MAG: imidazole glycerol phosphate synthase subunit HisF [Armatimonadetes bacterium]|nr:imidazole glycerol phosphate synthase subunit HisF [Armatimonadota bacterium]